MTAAKDETLNLRVTRDLRRRIKREAKAAGASEGAVLRSALRRGLAVRGGYGLWGWKWGSRLEVLRRERLGADGKLSRSIGARVDAKLLSALRREVAFAKGDDGAFDRSIVARAAAAAGLDEIRRERRAEERLTLRPKVGASFLRRCKREAESAGKDLEDVLRTAFDVGLRGGAWHREAGGTREAAVRYAKGGRGVAFAVSAESRKTLDAKLAVLPWAMDPDVMVRALLDAGLSHLERRRAARERARREREEREEREERWEREAGERARLRRRWEREDREREERVKERRPRELEEALAAAEGGSGGSGEGSSDGA